MKGLTTTCTLGVRAQHMGVLPCEEAPTNPLSDKLQEFHSLSQPTATQQPDMGVKPSETRQPPPPADT